MDKELILEFEAEMTVSRDALLEQLERRIPQRTGPLRGFYQNLLDEIINEIESGDLRPDEVEAFVRQRVAAAAQQQELSSAIMRNMQADLSSISRHLGDTFEMLDRPVNVQEARTLARGRIGNYVLEADKRIGDRLATELGALGQQYHGEEFYSMARARINITGNHWRTVADNVLAGYDREMTRQLAGQGGLNYWKYRGVIGENTRFFCRQLLKLGYVYTMDQVMQMDNGQRLDVLTFAGGYRCVHSFVPGREGWPGFERPYQKDGRFTRVPVPGSAGRFVVIPN